MGGNIKEIRTRAGQSTEFSAAFLEICVQRLKKDATRWGARNRSLFARKTKFTR